MNPSLENKLEVVENYLRLGQRLEAQKLLSKLVKSNHKNQRKYLSLFASKLRRSGLTEIAVKMLFPYVRRRGLSFKVATLCEKQEYAAALIDLGAIDEAKILLNDLKSFNSPKTALYLGFTAVSQWDYESAKTYFIKYLQAASISEYESLIGLVNLKACEVFLNYSASEALKLNMELEELIHTTKKREFKVLYANLIEIQSQLLIKNQELNRSKNHLEKIRSIINDPSSKENLFIQKWKLISQKPSLHSDKNDQSEWLHKMCELQTKAKALNHGETARDIDFHLAAFLPELAPTAYFGSKSHSFRQKILKAYSLSLPSYYWHSLNLNPSQSDFQFDYLEYPDLKLGSIIHRVLMAIVSDFYQVQNKYSLIFKIFPNDFFSPLTSINKFHQALNRTREWLQKHKIPFQISEQNSHYFLSGRGKIKIYRSDIDLNNNDDLKMNHLLDDLKSKLTNQAFTSKEVVTLLQLSGLRKAQRVLSSALKQGLIQGTKKGRTLSYSFIET